MMNVPQKRFLIAGRANAGKTLFMLNFAEYLGYKELTIKLKSSDEVLKSDDISFFKKSMVNENPNTTRCLQHTSIKVPALKAERHIEFIDSTGISSSIHFAQDVREGMVQTLTFLKNSCVIFHMIDAPSIANDKKIDDIDMELYKYGRKRGSYLVLANKADLDDFNKGYQIITEEFFDVRIIKISALYKTGFNEVKKYVSKLA